MSAVVTPPPVQDPAEQEPTSWSIALLQFAASRTGTLGTACGKGR